MNEYARMRVVFQPVIFSVCFFYVKVFYYLFYYFQYFLLPLAASLYLKQYIGFYECYRQ